MHFDINDIMKMIPHRYPFLLIDKVIDFVPNEKVVAIKNISVNEPMFVGHFPGHPIMPGVLIIEAMAQACAVCAIASLGAVFNGKPVYFTGLNDAKFRKPVIPGDILHIEASVARVRSLFWKFACRAFNANKELVSEADINATISRI